MLSRESCGTAYSCCRVGKRLSDHWVSDDGGKTNFRWKEFIRTKDLRESSVSVLLWVRKKRREFVVESKNVFLIFSGGTSLLGYVYGRDFVRKFCFIVSPSHRLKNWELWLFTSRSQLQCLLHVIHNTRIVPLLSSKFCWNHRSNFRVFTFKKGSSGEF